MGQQNLSQSLHIGRYFSLDDNTGTSDSCKTLFDYLHGRLYDAPINPLAAAQLYFPNVVLGRGWRPWSFLFTRINSA